MNIEEIFSPEIPFTPLVTKKTIGITETSFRDGQQSILATRLRTEDLLPAAEMMDEVGYHSLEVWGGATFDSCIRFLNEDPWERLKNLRKKFRKSKLQMLLRGQALVGYRHYSDETVKEFVKRALGNGIDIIRVFDALNSLQNVEIAAECVKKEKGHLEMGMIYTISPVHTLEFFANLAVEMEHMGADSIALKDVAGIMNPLDAYNLVHMIKKRINVPLHVHFHCTSGMAMMGYMASILAGADVIDCAISPLSMGTSQPATETMVAALGGGPYDTGLSIDSLMPITSYFNKIKKKYGEFILGVDSVDVNVIKYQIPGGMYSNLRSQLKDMNASDKFQEVLQEVPLVRKEMGYPPLATPTSQLVGSQAVFNVLAGERWKIIPNEVRDYFAGLYGIAPGPMDEVIQRKIIGDQEPVTCRPGKLIPPELKEARNKIKYWFVRKEDVLTYVLFPTIAEKHLRNKYCKVVMRDIGLEESVDGTAYPV